MHVHLSYRTIQTNLGWWHRGIQRHTEKPQLTRCACLAEGEFRFISSHILQLLDENLKSKGVDWRKERTKKELQMDKLMEKRHHERMIHNTIATLESLQNGINENSRMVNCSGDGLYFESDQLLLPGAEVFIRIDSFPHSPTGSYRCHHVKVKWGKRLKNSTYAYGYGVKYVEPYNEEYLLGTDLYQKKDLRKHPRKYFDKPATFGFENKSYEGFISNLSRNGCFIENHEFLNIRQIIELVIPGTIFNENNMLKVEVTRLSPIGVGVKFKSILKKEPKK